MTTRRIVFVLALLSSAAIALAAGLPARAADGDEERAFYFTLDPVVLQPLFVDVDTESSKFEEYRDMDSGMVIPMLRLFGESGSHNRTFEFEAVSPGRADERYTLRYGNSGRYSIMLDYNVIPHRFGNDGTLIYSNSNPTSLRIADSSQQDLQNQVAAQSADPNLTVDFAFLSSILQPYINTAQSIDLSLDRKRARARIDILKMQRLSWSIDISQETRQGNRPYGGSFGFNNVLEVPEPIDYRTTSADVAGEWNGRRSGVRFGVRFSRFDNMNPDLTYDNPFRATDSTDASAYIAPGNSIGGASVGRNALAPDNTASDIYVQGRARFGRHGWFNGSLRYGMMSQDQRFLPYTTNTAIDPNSTPAAPFVATNIANLPEESADTEVKLLNFSARAGTRFASKFTVQGNVSYYDYDNSSAEIVFPGYVRFDAVWEAIPRMTVPFSWTKERAGVEFGWDVARSTHLALGYTREMWERENREIKDSDEDIFKLTLNHRQGSRWSIRGSIEHGNRTTDEYNTEAMEATFVNPSGITNLPGLRKYDEAERIYDAGNVSTMVMVSDSVSITGGVTLRNEDYDESEFGLNSYDSVMYNAEVDYTPSEKISLFVFVHRTDAESFQRARQSGGTLSTNPADDWELTLDETTDTIGLGFESRFARTWTGRVQGQWSNSDGDTDFFSPPGGNPNRAEGFPEYDDNEWLVLSGRLGKEITPNVAAGVTYVREEYTTNRFQRDGLSPYLPGSLILNPEDGDYTADIVAVDMRIAF
jgi:MtrB/PioB family decaheme-associated outer membrane protein